MQFIRGTTPTIEITVTTQGLDLHQVAQVWIYVAQQNKVKVDKELSDVTFDYEHKKMFVTLTQEDTLGLKEGDAIFQIRMLLMDGTALATTMADIEIADVKKGGVITETEGEVSGE